MVPEQRRCYSSPPARYADAASCTGDLPCTTDQGTRQPAAEPVDDLTGSPKLLAMAERLARTGIDPKLVGERVLDAIRSKTFYAFVSAVPVDTIKARHRRIEAALETLWATPY